MGHYLRICASVVVLLISSALLAPPVKAEDGVIHTLRLGVLSHDVGDLWSGFRREDGVDFNVEAQLNYALPIFEGNLRPALGASINSEGDTSKAYLDARWEVVVRESLLFALGIGAAVHDGNTDSNRRDKKALGSRVLFHIPIELGFFVTERVSASLFFDHVSNAYLADENEGLDTIGFRIGYRF